MHRIAHGGNETAGRRCNERRGLGENATPALFDGRHARAGAGEFLADEFECSVVSCHCHFAKSVGSNFFNGVCQIIHCRSQELRERAGLKLWMNAAGRKETRVELSSTGAEY